jgi:hypothetical protein
MALASSIFLKNQNTKTSSYRPGYLWRALSLVSIRETEVRHMPQFVIEREIPGLGNMSDAELREASRKSVAVLKALGPEIQWLQSYVTGDKLYCVYLAPDEALIREHAKRGGFPANRISAVRRLIDPTTAE